MNIRKYLERIQYKGSLNPDLETLKNLQLAHLLSVPFENLDIHNHVAINLNESYDKIVKRHRGGFCYELNGLFFQLLQEIGFNAKLISARVFDSERGFGPEFDHAAIIVLFEKEKYLTDVGFGEFTFYPLKIELNKVLQDPRGIFYMETDDDRYITVKKKTAEDTFVPEYLFSERPRLLNEFNEMCRFHQTSELSHFTKKRICSLPVLNGRISLTNNILRTTDNGFVNETQLSSEEEVTRVLKDIFKIEIVDEKRKY